MYNANNMRKILSLVLGMLLMLLGLIAVPAFSVSPPAVFAAQLTVFPTPTPGPDGRILYIIQPNDTLWRISAITGVSIEDLRDLNNLGPDDPIKPGDIMLIGLAGPAEISPTPGPSPTAAPQVPTPTSEPGWGNLCVILYNDQNGDSMRQEEEPSIPRGQINVSNRSGSVSLTAETPSGGNSPDALTAQEKGYTCFEELAEGVYIVTVAIPEGHNPTTVLNRTLELESGDETFLSFGAQANSETQAETAIIPESPRRSPLLGIAGGVILLIGIGLGIYAGLLRRTKVL
jgi:murein DD-endopeptidase MepM/ murein hydrolase activator NlpD